MGVKKGDKRSWDIHKNKNPKDLLNKNINFRISEEDFLNLKLLQQKGFTYREILITGIKNLLNNK